MSDRIEKRIELKAPVARVWRAITDHREFGQWFRVALDAPFEPGKDSHGHMLHPGYEHVKWNATVQEMQPEHLFSFSWRPYAIEPGVDYSSEPQTLVEFRLEAIPEGTLLVITESGFDGIPEHRRSEAFRMNERGWEAQLRNVERHVAENP